MGGERGALVRKDHTLTERSQFTYRQDYLIYITWAAYAAAMGLPVRP